MWVRLQEFWSLATNLDYFWKHIYLSAILCLKQKLQNLSPWPCDDAAKPWISPRQSLPPCWTPVNSHIFSGRGACFPFSVDGLWSASVNNRCLWLPAKQLSSSSSSSAAASATSSPRQELSAAEGARSPRSTTGDHRVWETQPRSPSEHGHARRISNGFIRDAYFHQKGIKGQLNEGLLHLGSIACFWK